MPEHAQKEKHEAHHLRLTAGLDEELIAKRSIPEKWSLKELVCHLHRVQEVFAGRVGTMPAQDNPVISQYEPVGYAEFERTVAHPAKDSLASFLETRERLAWHLDQLAPPEWHRGGRHPEFPHYDIHFQVEYMAHREAHHIDQMLSIKCFQRRVPLGKIRH